MDTRTFLGLEPTHNRFRWKLPVTSGICTGGDFMFGGAGLGAAIAAMEGTSGRSTIWATAQYLSYARPGEVVDIDVVLAVEGHQMTQARAVCHVADREILTVNAALGERPFDRAAQFEIMPTDVPPPEECPDRIFRFDPGATINARLDQRLARGRTMEELDGTPGDHVAVRPENRVPRAMERRFKRTRRALRWLRILAIVPPARYLIWPTLPAVPMTCSPKTASGFGFSKAPSFNIRAAPPSSPVGAPSSAGWKINFTVPGIWSFIPASTSATPMRIAICVS